MARRIVNSFPENASVCFNGLKSNLIKQGLSIGILNTPLSKIHCVICDNSSKVEEVIFVHTFILNATYPKEEKIKNDLLGLKDITLKVCSDKKPLRTKVTIYRNCLLKLNLKRDHLQSYKNLNYIKPCSLFSFYIDGKKLFTWKCNLDTILFKV